MGLDQDPSAQRGQQVPKRSLAPDISSWQDGNHAARFGDASVWPIEQQQGLFSLLGDVEERVGVKLTDSFLMVPNKTTSGILFPTETDFRSCEVCHREDCPSRHAAFNKSFGKRFRMVDWGPWYFALSGLCRGGGRCRVESLRPALGPNQGDESAGGEVFRLRDEPATLRIAWRIW